MNLKSSLFTLSLLIFGAYYILRHDEVPFLAKSIDTNQIDVQYQFSMPPTSNVIYREVFSFTTDSAAGGPRPWHKGGKDIATERPQIHFKYSKTLCLHCHHPIWWT